MPILLYMALPIQKTQMKLMFMTITLCILGTIVAADAPKAKLGCQDTCGNVTIPYPFGIGSKCFSTDWYEITCNASSPVLAKFGLEVLRISLEGKLSVKSSMAINCVEPNKTWNSPNLMGSPYSYASSRNMFVPINCTTTSLSYRGIISAQCGSKCESRRGSGSQVSYGYSGLYYDSSCLTPLPFSLTSYSVNITPSTKGECSYPVMMDNDFFEDYRTSGQLALLNASKGGHIPVVLKWVYGYSSYLSSVNVNSSYCDISNQDTGECTCRCPPGEGGNPYLPDGCQEVEGCAKCKGGCDVISDDFTLTQYECAPAYKSRARDDFTLTQYECAPTYKSRASWAHTLGVIKDLSFVIGLLVLAFVCNWLWKCLKRRKDAKRRAKNFKQNGGLLLQKTKIFTVRELETATDNFNPNRILGQGGQGTVYKGMLADGRIIAVKKSKVDESQREPFINEVIILSQINHRNVVKLLGCCLETEVPLLVYEYIPNGALSKHIHNPTEDFHISWKMRLQIAAESAGAIAYLHSASSTPVYHRDIKSSNILLDDKYRAKVSDFGISRTLEVDQTHLTTQVQGTFGYFDPEYFQSQQFTDKSDVYSFGVVLIELLTSQRPISPDQTKQWRSLATEFLFMMENSRLLDIVDPQVSKGGQMGRTCCSCKACRKLLEHERGRKAYNERSGNNIGGTYII